MFRRLALTLALASAVLAPMISSSPAAASTVTTYSVPSVSATPHFQCNDSGCGALIGYDYTGDGTCSSGCVGYPTDPIHVTLTFSVTRTFRNNPCKMKAGTGTLDASWPSDPNTPSAQGTFSFKAKGSRTNFSGQITSSTVPGLFPPSPWRGFVTFPPSPCTGGTAAAQVSFITG
jgi:hypothetical protein